MGRSTRCRIGAALLAVVGTAVLASPAVAYVPHSGDVDLDARLTVRDAVTILESLSWPERPGLRAFLQACDFTHDGSCDVADANAIFMAAVRDMADWDGDQVPNAADCAPFDERLATPHTFYRDWDMDHGGDATAPTTVCSVVPEWPLVEWLGDASDVNQFSLPVPVPKGARVLGLDMTDLAEDGRWRGDLATELGVDAVTIRLPWSAIETQPGVFDGMSAALDIYRQALLAGNLEVSLGIDPVTSGAPTLPSDLQVQVVSGALRLNDPLVIARFSALLAHVRAKLDGVAVASVQIGYEVDLTLSQAPAYFWSDYAALLEAAVADVKRLWGTATPVGVTATRDGLMSGTSGPLLQALNSLTDVVSFTYFPRSAASSVPEATTVRLDIEQVLAKYYPKPLYLQAAGYPSAPLTGSSETKQTQFVRALFDVWDSWAPYIPYVGLARLSDLSPAEAARRAAADGGSPSAAAYHRTLGLRTYRADGTPKAAYRTLRNMAFNRGWWRMTLPATRRFRMGFTPAFYDFPVVAQDFADMLAWLRGAAAADADISHLHLDNGVPWVEALADTFGSADLPYSQAVKDLWGNMRATVPAGQTLVVSINPLGVPRDVIAPYFGVGQGFIYDEQTRRVPDGVVRDAENRYPPAPWDTHRLNHPDVKKAYLNYAKRAARYFQPDYLTIAIEVTATMLRSPQTYGDLLELLQFTYAGLKADPMTAGVPVMVSVSATSFVVDEYGLPLKAEEQEPRMRMLQLQGLLDLASVVDVLGLSFYPHYGKYNATTVPAFMFDGLFSALKLLNKRVAVTESGFPAETYDVLAIPFLSDEAKQDRYLQLMLAEFERSPVPVDFFIHYKPRDSDLGWERLREGSQQTPPTVSAQFVEFYKYFRDTGLFDGAGGATRPALGTWRSHLAKPLSPR